MVKLNRKINETEVVILAGNSLDYKLLKSLDLLGKVDGIITSPPYNIGVKYDGFEDKIENHSYDSFLSKMLTIFALALKDSGSAFINLFDKVSNMDNFMARDWIRPLFLQNLIIWVKSLAINDKQIGQYKPLNSNHYLNNCYEFIYHCRKKEENLVPLDRLGLGVPYSDKSNVERYNSGDLHCAGNVWFVPYKTRQRKLEHPASFPEEIPSRCIRLLPSKSEAVIFDPFLGSGTTALAAIRNGVKKFVGIDISEKYAMMSVERILNEFPQNVPLV